jgi:hypothetical protein
VAEQPDAAAQVSAGLAGGLLAVADLPRRRIEQRRGNGQQRGLAGAVRAQHRDELSGGAVERNVGQDAPAAEMTGDADEAQRGKVRRWHYAAASSSISA